MNKNIFNIRMGEKLQERVELLRDETKKQKHDLKIIKREYDLYAMKNSGLEEIEKQFFNGGSKLPYTVATTALKDEIKRLMHVIATQQELIVKTPFITSSIPQLRKPILLRSTNPLRQGKYYLNYRKEKKAYEYAVKESKKAEFHLTIKKDDQGIQIDRNGTKSYKSEYLQEYNSHLRVGAKLKRFYYLADIPAYLSPYLFFKLLTSSLPFTLSIFIEPSPSSELLKKARQRPRRP
jgi:hypothetical protein